MANLIEETLKNLQLTYKTIDDGSKIISEHEDAISDLVNVWKKEETAIKNATTHFKTMQKAIKEGTTDIRNLKKAYDEEIKKLIEIAKQEKEDAQIRKMVNDEVKRQTRTTEDYIRSLKTQKDMFMDVIGTALSYGKVVGAQAITLTGMKDRVVKYNQSLYDLKRVQGLAGAGFNNLDAVMKKVSATTYMGQNDFLEFANAVTKMHLGIKPTVDEIADMAGAIQNEFGPNLETTIAIANELYAVQNKWPSLFNNIQSAHKAMADGMKSGDSNLIASSKQLGAANVANLLIMGADDKTVQDAIRYQSALAEGKDALPALNKEIAKTSQSAADTELKTGQLMEKAMTDAAKATRQLYDVLKDMPQIIVAISTAMTLIDLAGPMYKGVKGVKALADASKLARMGSAVEGGVEAVASAGTKVAAPVAAELTTVSAGLGTTIGTTIGPAIIAGMAGWQVGKLIDEGFGSLTKLFGGSGRSLSTVIGEGAGNAISSTDTEGSQAKRDEAHAKNLKAWAPTAEQQKLKTDAAQYSFSVGQASEKYQSVKADAAAVLGIDQQTADAVQKQLSLQEESGIITKEALNAVTQVHEKVLEDINAQAKGLGPLAEILQMSLGTELKGKINFIAAGDSPEKLREELKKAIPLEIEINKGKVEKEIKSAQERMANIDAGGGTDEEKADKENAKLKIRQGLEAKITAIKAEQVSHTNTLSQVEGTISSQKQMQYQVGKDIVNASYKDVEQRMEFNSILGSTLSIQRQVMESGQFGLGASVAMMQKQVDLAYASIDAMKKGNEDAKKRLPTELNINAVYLDRIESARSDMDIQKAINEGAAEAGINHKEGVTAAEAETKARSELVGFFEKSNKMQQGILGKQKEINDLTKEVREGYLSAIKSMAVGAGAFSKIIGNQSRGTSQLMDITKRVTGTYETNTMAMGGKVAKGTDLGKGPLYAASVSGGIQAQYSSEDEARFAANRNYFQTKTGTGHVGNALVDSAAMSAIKQAGTQTNGGGNISTPAGAIPTTQQMQDKMKSPLKDVVNAAPQNYNGVNQVVTASSAPSSTGNQSPSGTPNLPATGGKDKLDTLIDRTEDLYKILDTIRVNGMPVTVRQ